MSPCLHLVTSLHLVLAYGSGSKESACNARDWDLIPAWGRFPHQAPLSMKFSRQEYWSGLMFSTPRDLSDPRIEPAFLSSPSLAGRLFSNCATWEAFLFKFLAQNSQKLHLALYS